MLTPNTFRRLRDFLRSSSSPAAGFVFPALSSAKYDGDSRTDNMGGLIVSAGSVTATGGFGAANGSAGLIQAVLGNKYLLGQGFQHAIGASTTESMMYRAQSTSVATSGNPAFNSTAATTDAYFSRDSDGATTVLTQPGGLVVSASMSVNDGGGSSASFYDTATGSGHPNALAVHTLENIGTYADNLLAAGKGLLIGNEIPRGRAAYQMEAKTVSGGTVTATNVGGFIDGESYGAPGVIGQGASGLPKRLTKVSSAPAQDQYTVSSAGAYAFGGTPPVNVWISYTATLPGVSTTTDRQRIANAFCNSSAASFVSSLNGIDYKQPGLKARKNVIVFDSFNALLDPTSGATQLPLPGTQDILQLHNNQLGALKLAKAAKTAFDIAYPGAASQETRPTRNNWYVAKGTGGASQVYSGTLPPSMRSVTPTIVSINGVALGSVDGSGNITGTGITSGSLNYSTGAWTITFSAPATSMPANAQLWFEQDIGNFNVAAMTEGTIGRNAVLNGLMDMTAAVGTNLTATTGTSSIMGIANSQIPYGWTLSSTAFNAALTNATATIAVSTVATGDGFNTLAIDVEGYHTANISLALSQTINGPGARMSPGDRIMTGARIIYANHPTNGALYGTTGLANTAAIVSSSAVTRNGQSVTNLSTRTLDGSTTAGSNLYIDGTLVAEQSGPLDLYRLSPQLDMTGVVYSSTGVTLAVGCSPNVPFAGRFQGGQSQLRRRNDVA